MEITTESVGETASGLKQLLLEVRIQLQSQLEQAESLYDFDFVAGKPIARQAAPQYVWFDQNANDLQDSLPH